jgi:hypothetical protein
MTLDLHRTGALAGGVSHTFVLQLATTAGTMVSNGALAPYAYAQKLGTIALPASDMTSP